MAIRIFTITFALILLPLLEGQAGTKPNIIVVLVDDMGYSDTGAYGGEVRTPNIDRLARGGLHAICRRNRLSSLHR